VLPGPTFCYGSLGQPDPDLGTAASSLRSKRWALQDWDERSNGRLQEGASHSPSSALICILP
jgi:hypothetical protein